MRPGDQRQDSQGGIPDGLLIGILAFLLGMTLLVWSATGLAGLFAHGAWPDGVTFTRTPLAMRYLVRQPHDIAGAWPQTPDGQLTGYGLFWGLFIGQLLVLIVLTVFVMGTLARWRAMRAGRLGASGAGQGDVPSPRTEAEASGDPRQPRETHTRYPDPHQPTATQGPHPTELLQKTAPPAHRHTPVADGEPMGGWEKIHLGTPESRHTTATQAVRDAAGPALVVTSNPAIWQDTKDARAKLGPVHLYDPTHLCDTPARLHWSPTAGCEDKQTAAQRATALLTPVSPTSKLDQALLATAETLLRSYLHAAAIDGRTVRHVHRWSQGTQIQDAVRILRTNPKAAPGSAGELEATLTAHPERRDMAQELTTRALTSLSTVNIREACTPNRTDALALDSFVHEGGTLYVVGESIEDPRANPGAMPFLTALAANVVERGRRMAERSSSGRLDPPMTLVLDDVAAVAPLPQLPELLATGADRGLPTLALLRSREQARSRWPHDELPV
ncbi:type VI secretion protein [Streptomyces dysideae]|uniref:Type VI secretion protein n=2 Tax=Streptomyces dysideae TaxID=909626 RepID=A0A117S0Z8_9ACTN|nr:type IV secretory system conjugative DNA transfer family protein [Streptomyces dysideae]KUO20541.1 type VI secretion protein [Streptomyces dysideae]